MNATEIAVPITVALITAVIPATITAVVQVRRLRKENTQQHDQNHSLLKTIHEDVKDVRDDVKQVRSDLDRHLGEHDAMKPYRRVK